MLLIENDEALGHWLLAVLQEAGCQVDWQRDATSALAQLNSAGASYALAIVEGVLGGQGPELCAEARRCQAKAILLIPRGGAAITGVADRILEHPLTRTGLLESLDALGVRTSEAPPAPDAAARSEQASVKAQADAETEEQRRLRQAAQDRLRLGLAALQEGNFSGAVIELEAASVLLPDDPRPRLYAAWARYGRTRAAVLEAAGLRTTIEHLATALDEPDGYYFGASAAYDFGDLDKAVRGAQAALERDSGHAGARELLEILSGGG